MANLLVGRRTAFQNGSKIVISSPFQLHSALVFDVLEAFCQAGVTVNPGSGTHLDILPEEA
jgi:hypothetical protein